MGTFIGHAVPGTFFFLFGVWFLVQGMRRYFRCRHRGIRFRSTMTYQDDRYRGLTGHRCLSDAPPESMVKLVACVIGIGVEVYGGINFKTHRFETTSNIQHITMYFFFFLTGVFDILTIKGLAPPNSDYMSVVIALLVEGALFKFHLYGRTELDVLLHVLLLYVIGFGVLIVALEAALRSAPILPIMRGFLSMLQGTWFWAIGHLIFNPLGTTPWEPDGHQSLMMAVCCFSWHVAVNLVFVLIAGVVIGSWYGIKERGIGSSGARFGSRGSARYTSIPLKRLQSHRAAWLNAGFGNRAKFTGVDELDEVAGWEDLGLEEIAEEDAERELAEGAVGQGGVSEFGEMVVVEYHDEVKGENEGEEGGDLLKKGRGGDDGGGGGGGAGVAGGSVGVAMAGGL